MSVAGWMDGCLAGWLAWLLFHCTRALYVTIFFNRIKYQPLKDAIIIFLFIMKQTTRSGGSLAPPSLLLLCFFYSFKQQPALQRVHDVCLFCGTLKSTYYIQCSHLFTGRRQRQNFIICVHMRDAFKPLLNKLPYIFIIHKFAWELTGHRIEEKLSFFIIPQETNMILESIRSTYQLC